MSKKQPEKQQAKSVTVTLAEFCARLSESVRRPELIGAFEYVERSAGRLRDAPADYQARFESFCNAPA